MTTIIDRIRQIIDYKGVSERLFCKEIGVANGFIAKVKDVGSSKLNKILYTYPDINPVWLLTGEGEMIIDSNTQPQVFKVETGGIPLIPIDAMAGYMSDNSRGVLDYECERYIVPMFRGAEFLISVKGSSMQPKYNSGDLVACKKVPIDTFFLWHKVYVIDTEQGVLIKRIEKSDMADHIVLSSDNPAYPPVDIHRQKINSIAIVMGVIRLE